MVNYCHWDLLKTSMGIQGSSVIIFHDIFCIHKVTANMKSLEKSCCISCLISVKHIDVRCVVILIRIYIAAYAMFRRCNVFLRMFGLSFFRATLTQSLMSNVNVVARLIFINVFFMSKQKLKLSEQV